MTGPTSDEAATTAVDRDPDEFVPCPRHGTRCYPEIRDLAQRIECAIGLRGCASSSRNEARMTDGYAALFDPSPDAPVFPAAMGEILHAILHARPQPGPPYMHTIRPPEPVGYDEQGRPIWEPEPAFTITDVSDG